MYPRCVRGCAFLILTSIQPEIYFDGRCHLHRLSLLGRRFEAPLRNGVQRFLIQARIEAPLDAHIVRPPVGMHFQIHHHRALDSGILGGLGVLGVHFRKNRGCDDAVFMGAMNRLVVLSAADTGWDSSCDTADHTARNSRHHAACDTAYDSADRTTDDTANNAVILFSGREMYRHNRRLQRERPHRSGTPPMTATRSD